MPLTGEKPAEQLGQLTIPSNPNMITIPLEAGGRDKEKTQFSADMPADLGSAIRLEGEVEIMKRVVQSMVIEKQGEKRREIAAKEDGKEGTRAKYMQQFGF